jgi:enoyl-CoA hydratase/carnithine racemase
MVEMNGAAAIIRLTRPHKRNPLSLAVLDELENTLAALIPRPEIKALIFTGDDGVFSAGADLREVAALTPLTAPAFSRRGQAVFRQIADAPQLTIAAVNGYCYGGGLDLALACKIRVAAPEALFAHPGAERGIITGWGGTQRLPRLIGPARALELFLTGRACNAREALEWGLIEAVGASALDAARRISSPARP